MASARIAAVAVTADSNHTGCPKLLGFCIREAAGTPAVAVARLRDAAVDGDILAEIGLVASDTKMLMFPEPLDTSSGVYVQEVSGTIAGVLYTGNP